MRTEKCYKTAYGVLVRVRKMEDPPFCDKNGVIFIPEESIGKTGIIVPYRTMVVELDRSEVIGALGKELHMIPYELLRLLIRMDKVGRAATTALFLKMASRMMERATGYKIEQAKEIWAISSLTNQVVRYDMTKVPFLNVKELAYFYSPEEARLALSLVP